MTSHSSAERSNSIEGVGGRILFAADANSFGAPQLSAHQTHGNGASALSQRTTKEDKSESEGEDGRKRRFEDSLDMDGKENFKAQVDEESDEAFEERRPVYRQPPLGVVRTLCREAAESRFLHRSEGWNLLFLSRGVLCEFEGKHSEASRHTYEGVK